jgi:hypothetical protein
MIKPLFENYFYKPLDTWLVSECVEVNELINFLYLYFQVRT